jgi:hypothetical protein
VNPIDIVLKQCDQLALKALWEAVATDLPPVINSDAHPVFPVARAEPPRYAFPRTLLSHPAVESPVHPTAAD